MAGLLLRVISCSAEAVTGQNYWRLARSTSVGTVPRRLQSMARKHMSKIARKVGRPAQGTNSMPKTRFPSPAYKRGGDVSGGFGTDVPRVTSRGSVMKPAKPPRIRLRGVATPKKTQA